MATPPRVHNSSTHTGGIQPSAAFFRPSKPIYQSSYSRPASPDSIPDDHFHLAPFPADDHTTHIAESINGAHDDPPNDHFISLKRIKQSREPLLPVPAAAQTTSRTVRNSIDRVFSISRGLSFDSIRRVPTPRSPLPSAVDSKGHDEENPRSKRHSRTHSHNHNQSLDVRHSRNSALVSASATGPSTSSSPSPSPSAFNPRPPTRRPPLSAIPLLDPQTGRPVRRYELHPSRNRFFLRGRILTGGDTPYAFIASFTVLLTISGLWFGTTSVWWWKNESPAVAAVGAYVALLALSTMLAAATIDPGILPRNLDPDPPYPATSPSDGGIRAPMPRDLKVRSDVVRVKYCPTCKTYRPPRSSHCKMCDNCVDGCDHHCQWVNNCVGRRNYTTFFVLLVSATIGLLLFIVTSALHLFFLTRREQSNGAPPLDFRHVLMTGPGVGSALVFLMSVCVVWPVAALLSYHMRLLLLNITTIEQIRNQAHKTLIPGPAPPNPFSHGNWRRNLLAVLGRPQGYSWLDAHGVVTEDKREANPGLGAEGDERGHGHGHGHGGGVREVGGNEHGGGGKQQLMLLQKHRRQQQHQQKNELHFAGRRSVDDDDGGDDDR